MSTTKFLPKKSNGGIWSIGFLVGTLLIFCIPLAFLGVFSDPWFIGLMGALILLMGLVLGLTVHGFYSMKYEVSDEFLIFRWSFFKKTIPLQDITSVSSVSKTNLQGIRSFGVGIPGHLVGRFQLKLNGEFLATTLYATKLNNLVILRTSDNKTYGITPENVEEFMNFIQSIGPLVKKTEMDTLQPIRVSASQLKKIQTIISTLFIICIILAVGTFTYFLIAYQNLPETGVPLHWGIDGLPDRYGNKSELLIMVSIFTGVELLISVLVHIWMRKSDFGKVRLGKLIMLFPLIINLVFSTLFIVIMQATLSYF